MINASIWLAIFCLSIFVIFWAYFGYFIALAIISRLYRRKIVKNDDLPKISFIVTAYNEELRIRRKIEILSKSITQKISLKRFSSRTVQPIRLTR
jgi:cellulose synthase/poly-beta-1,6-N-acetylglucosamine synthase-like glycosyltransferase